MKNKLVTQNIQERTSTSLKELSIRVADRRKIARVAEIMTMSKSPLNLSENLFREYTQLNKHWYNFLIV